MRGQELGVEQAVAAETQPHDQMDEGDFARGGLATEHAFAKESRADRDPVQSTHQSAAAPAFDTVRRPAREEGLIEPHDLVVDPGVWTLLARFGAAADDRGEGAVAADLKPALPQQAAQPVRDM